MTATEAIRARLASLSAVTTLVGSRIYDQHLKQGGPWPQVLIRMIDEGQGMHLRGISGLRRARVQIDAVSDSEDRGADVLGQARDLEAAIFGDGAGSALAAWAGDIGSPAFTVTGIIPLDKREGYDPDAVKQFVVTRDYWVFHKG